MQADSWRQTAITCKDWKCLGFIRMTKYLVKDGLWLTDFAVRRTIYLSHAVRLVELIKDYGKRCHVEVIRWDSSLYDVCDCRRRSQKVDAGHTGFKRLHAWWKWCWYDGHRRQLQDTERHQRAMSAQEITEWKTRRDAHLLNCTF